MSKKVLLRDVAYEKIKQKILNESYKDNQIFSENDLVKELNMSRTPIREALQRLQDDRLIDISSYKGIIIRELSIKETNDLMDMRMAIELYIIKNYFDQITSKDIDQLSENLKKQEEVISEENFIEFWQLDIEFHRLIIGLSENNAFKEIWANVNDRFLLHGIRRSSKRPKSANDSLKEHKEILEKIKKKDLESCYNDLENHILHGKVRLFNGSM